ncbi:tetratricopeptide repeat protein [Flavobacteriaceae bacterium R38]|nr:tetratricopeptide repeat protein [Flavobacteriaceae bacterium R38]
MNRRLINSTLLFISLLMISLSVCSQDITDREMKLKEEWKDMKVIDLFRVFDKKFHEIDTLATRLAVEVMLNKAKKGDNKEDYLTAYRSAALLCERNGEYQKGIDYMNKAIPYLKEYPEYYNKAAIYDIRGSLYESLGNYEESIKNKIEALEVAKEEGNIAYQISLMSNIAFTKGIIYDTKEALEMHFESLKILEENPDAQYIKEEYDDYLIEIYINIVKAYTYIKDFDKGIFYSNKVLKLCEKHDDEINRAKVLYELGNIYSLTGEYDKAIYFLEQASKNNNEGDHLNVFIHLAMVRCFFYLEYYQETLAELQTIEKLKDKYKFDFFVLQEVYAIYARTHLKLNNTEKAIAYFKQGEEVFKSNDERKSKLSKDIIERYNMASFDERVNVLTNKTKRQKTIFSLGLGILVLGILFFTTYYLNIHRNNKRKFELLITQLEQKSKGVIVEERNALEIPEDRIDKEKIEELLNKLEKFEKKYGYIDQKVTLHSVAKQFNTNTTYLSKVINQYKGKSFVKYITDLRLDYAIDQIKNNEKFKLYTIDTVAREAGFKSTIPFTKAFKAKTGINPSYFIKNLK